MSAGEGIDGANGDAICSEDTWGQPSHNAGLAFGPVLAANLDAAYHLIGISGIGMHQNWNTGPGVDTMPTVYDRTFTELSSSPDWDHTQFVPDAIVIDSSDLPIPDVFARVMLKVKENGLIQA